MINPFDYYFYRVTQNVGKNSYFPLMGFTQNIIAVILWFNVITVMGLAMSGRPPLYSLIICAISVAVFSWVYCTKRRFARLEEKYSKETKEQRFKRGVIISIYLILTPVLFYVVFTTVAPHGAL